MMNFYKMQGTGNDFIICQEGIPEKTDWGSLAVKMCDRHFGIGSDGLIIIGKSSIADISMRMFNPDGTESEMCGNGIRCVGKLAYELGLSTKPEISIETLGGILLRVWPIFEKTEITKVKVDMGLPILDPKQIPVNVGGNPPVVDYPITLGEFKFYLSFVSMGNPHAIAFIEDDVDQIDLSRIGPIIESHDLFPNKTNFSIVNILEKDHMKVRVWERGAGITLACGTGASASFVAAHIKGLVHDSARVDLPGGQLLIEWTGEESVYMTGPAETVFKGSII
jgi:diaminopimelate epimerase